MNDTFDCASVFTHLLVKLMLCAVIFYHLFYFVVALWDRIIQCAETELCQNIYQSWLLCNVECFTVHFWICKSAKIWLLFNGTVVGFRVFLRQMQILRPCSFVLSENECNEYVMKHLADSDLIPS